MAWDPACQMSSLVLLWALTAMKFALGIGAGSGFGVCAAQPMKLRSGDEREGF